MLFNEKIKALRTSLGLPQRRIAAALDIDTATYSKIEKGERQARKEHVATLSRMLNFDSNALLTLWLADKLAKVATEDYEIAADALNLAAQNIAKEKSR